MKSRPELYKNLFRLMVFRPGRLLNLSIEICNGKPGRYLQNVEEIDRIVEENRQDDEEMAIRFNLW